MRIEVVYASDEQADVVTLALPAGTTVEQAIAASGIASRRPVDLGAVGIFGRRVAAATTLKDGDRVEIYRPLALDPKEQRRQRARRRR